MHATSFSTGAPPRSMRASARCSASRQSRRSTPGIRDRGLGHRWSEQPWNMSFFSLPGDLREVSERVSRPLCVDGHQESVSSNAFGGSYFSASVLGLLSVKRDPLYALEANDRAVRNVAEAVASFLADGLHIRSALETGERCNTSPIASKCRQRTSVHPTAIVVVSRQRPGSDPPAASSLNPAGGCPWIAT